MIDCHRCEHYYVTWNERFPHGCRGMGFRSRTLPSAEVYKSSGRPCLLYRPKKLPRHRPGSPALGPGRG